MTGAIANCRRCGEPASERDDWCAVCGTALRGLALSPARLLVSEHSESATVEIVGQGVLPTTYAVSRRHLLGAPKWVVPQIASDVARTLEPGEVDVVEFRFAPNWLPSGRGVQEEPGHYVLPFAIASLAMDSAGRVRRQSAPLTLVSPVRARVRPALAHTRMLPRQCVDDGRLVTRTVTFENAGGHPTRLVRVYVRDQGLSAAEADALARGDEELRAQHPQRILARGFVVCPPLSAPRDVGAGERYAHAVALKLREGAAQERDVAAAVHPFDVEIVFVLEDMTDGAKTREVVSRLFGTLAPAPDVVLSRGPLPPVRTHGARTDVEVMVRNPGAAAVTIARVEIAPIGTEHDDSEVPPFDWVRPAPAWNSPVVLAPGEERALVLHIDPDRRTGRALKSAWGERQITLFHDGWQPPDDRKLSFRLSAELGEVTALVGAVVGIDFGTSSSAVSLLHGERGAAFSLPLEPESDGNELPSVLFYRGGDPPFLFGTEAEHAAPIAYSNVVRSIKSVVAKDPDLTWAFLERGGASNGAEEHASQLRTFQSGELLSRFLVELKRRAEQGVRKLPHAFLDALDLTGRGVRFSHAVFTHPVNVTDSALRTLFAAARAAGLCPPATGDDDAQFAAFVRDACLDEALAASLAFVFALVAHDDGDAAVLRTRDTFSFLSVDVGGGTSDLALIEVRNVPAFLAGTAQTVEVERIASGGEARLGGDDFDRALADEVLNVLGKLDVTKTIDLGGVREAIAHPSYESFRRAGPRGGEAEAQKRWTAASALLRQCEQVKRALGDVGQVPLMPFSLPWPGSEGAEQTLRDVEVTLTLKDAEAVYAPLLQRLTASASALLADAGRGAQTIDAVLFTGKGSRLQALSDAVMQALGARDDVIALRPGSVVGFDEKRCVATGAAVWGDSRGHGGGWLQVNTRAAHQLDASFSVRRGPRFVAIGGLEAGAPLPARGVVEFGIPTQQVVLYRQGRAAFTFHLEGEVRALDVTVESRDVAYATINGKRVDAVPA